MSDEMVWIGVDQFHKVCISARWAVVKYSRHRHQNAIISCQRHSGLCLTSFSFQWKLIREIRGETLLWSCRQSTCASTLQRRSTAASSGFCIKMLQSIVLIFYKHSCLKAMSIISLSLKTSFFRIFTFTSFYNTKTI